MSCINRFEVVKVDNTLGIVWGKRKLTDLDFADDIALLGKSELSLQRLTDIVSGLAAKLGLRISSEKTKAMAIGNIHEPTIKCNGDKLECVMKFPYLGSCISKDGNSEADVMIRIGKATGVFRKMDDIWCNKTLSVKIKLRINTNGHSNCNAYLRKLERLSYHPA